jgi:hypothetical protein
MSRSDARRSGERKGAVPHAGYMVYKHPSGKFVPGSTRVSEIVRKSGTASTRTKGKGGKRTTGTTGGIQKKPRKPTKRKAPVATSSGRQPETSLNRPPLPAVPAPATYYYNYYGYNFPPAHLETISRPSTSSGSLLPTPPSLPSSCVDSLSTNRCGTANQCSTSAVDSLSTNQCGTTNEFSTDTTSADDDSDTLSPSPPLAYCVVSLSTNQCGTANECSTDTTSADDDSDTLSPSLPLDFCVVSLSPNQCGIIGTNQCSTYTTSADDHTASGSDTLPLPPPLEADLPFKHKPSTSFNIF